MKKKCLITPASIAVGATWGSQSFSLHEMGSVGSIAPYLPTARQARNPAEPLHAGVAYLLLGYCSLCFVSSLERGFPDGASAKIVYWGVTTMISASRSTALSSPTPLISITLNWEIYVIYIIYIFMHYASPLFLCG